MNKEDKLKQIDDIKDKLLDIKLSGYELILEKTLLEVLKYAHNLKEETMFKEDREENLNNHLYCGINIEDLKPYVLVVGCIGSGKSTYIKGAKTWDKTRKYFSIGSLNEVSMKIRKHADQIIQVKILKHNEEDTIIYE